MFTMIGVNDTMSLYRRSLAGVEMLCADELALRQILTEDDNLMATKGTLTYIDYSRETSTTTLNLEDIAITGLNFESVFQNFDEIKDAIDPLTLLSILQVGLNKVFPEVATVPTSKEAQREKKWIVQCRDTTQFLDVANSIPNPGYLKVWTWEIPGADLSLLADNSDKLVLSSGPGATFKAAIEANLRSPWNHSAGTGVTPTIEVLQVEYSGTRS